MKVNKDEEIHMKNLGISCGKQKVGTEFKTKVSPYFLGKQGICYSSTECSDKGGTAYGNCAVGFGRCCIIR